MHLLLNLVYAALLVMVSPWLLWRYLYRNKGRRGWQQKLLGRVPALPRGNNKRIWFHAVSVGEVKLLHALIPRILHRNPSCSIVISTTTETGYDVAVKDFPGVVVFFCPMDFSWAVRNTAKRIAPDLLVLMELELWPNLVAVTRSMGIPVMVANARLSESSFHGYRKIGAIVRRILAKLDMVTAQNETYSKRFVELGVCESRVRVTGNVKFDGARTEQDRTAARKLASDYRLFERDSGSHLFVAGSTQPDEDLIVVEAYRRLAATYPHLRMVLVPRHPEKVEAACKMMTDCGIEFVRRSVSATYQGSGRPVVVVDVIGELALWWSLADAAYVGGSMGSSRGGQNMIEPAALGVPVSFGPNTRNFQAEVEILLSADAARMVTDVDSLERFVRSTLDDPDTMRSMGSRGRHVVLEQKGAADRTVAQIERLAGFSSMVGTDKATPGKITSDKKRPAA